MVLRCIALAAVLAAPRGALSYAGTGVSVEDLRVGGYVDRGRFQLHDSSADGETVNRLGAVWGMEKALGESWTGRFRLQWMFWRNQATDQGLFHIAGLKFDSDMQGSLAWRSGPWHARGGLYDFKYNSDARHLGEYLLRSEAYPTILESAQMKDLFAPAAARVAGLEAGHSLPLLRQTALVYAEQGTIPVHDVSLVYLAAAGAEAAELGFGISWHRLWKLGKPVNSTVLSEDLREYVRRQGLDSRAVKLSLRGRLDLASLAGWKRPLVFYGEAALLGLKSDSLYYRDPVQRAPVMAGLELPGFCLLDGLAAEVEYLANPYLGRKYLISDATGSNHSPLPWLDDYTVLPRNRRDDWRWGLHLSRRLGPWMEAKARVASDHLRMLDWSGDYVSGEPLTRSTRDWYFLLRIDFHN